MRHTFFEDFEAGACVRTYRRTVTETDLVNFTSFAGLRLPMFIDEEFARRETPYGGRIAPGFLTASLSAGMLESVLGDATLAGLSMDGFRFTAPVRPGDTIGAEITIESRRETRDPGRGIVAARVRVENQRGEQVLEFTTTVLVRRRPV
jgi:acyl dehydratase